MVSITYVLAGPNYAVVFGLIAVGCSLAWGTRPLLLATITSAPIFLMIVWLYAIVGLTGYGLNMVTVSIAAISLGVGIDYVIHVIERFREEMEKGVGTMKSIDAVGGASGIALFGSAVRHNRVLDNQPVKDGLLLYIWTVLRGNDRTVLDC